MKAEIKKIVGNITGIVNHFYNDGRAPRLWEKVKRDSIKLFDRIVESPVAISTLALVICFPILFGIYLNFRVSQFFEGIYIEAFGMLFDIFVFGIFILWLNQINEKRRTIQGYKNEIEFFRGWESEEGMRRTTGNIKLLNEMGVTKIDLKDCYLAEANLKGRDLQGAELQRANLEGANLQEVILQGANLIGANLQNAKFQKAKLRGADLRGANASYANFQDADFEDVRLYATGQQTDLTGACLYTDKLSGTNFRNVILNEASLLHANFVGHDFQFAELNRAKLAGANFQKAKLKRAEFKEANLQGADLREAILDEAIFDDAILIDTKYSKRDGEKLIGAIFTAEELKAYADKKKSHSPYE